MMEPISEAIYEMLVRQGIDAGRPASRLATKGAVRSANRRRARIKARSSANADALTGSKADTAGGELQRLTGGEKRPIYLCWINPAAMRKSAAKRAPFLMIVK